MYISELLRCAEGGGITCLKTKEKKSFPVQETEAQGRNISYYAENGGATPMNFYLPDVVASFDLEKEIESF